MLLLQQEFQSKWLTHFEEEAHAHNGQDDRKNGYDWDSEDMRVAEEVVFRVVGHVVTDFVRVHHSWNGKLLLQFQLKFISLPLTSSHV